MQTHDSQNSELQTHEPKTMEQRIGRLEAIEAIKQLKYRYFQACDGKEPATVRECFLPGPIDLQYGRIGQFSDREQMVAVFTELACQEHIVEMHHGQNPRIELQDDDHATGEWGLYYYMIDTRREVVTQLAGVYYDEYVRSAETWYIAASRCDITSTQLFDLTEGLARVIFAGETAPPELDDPGAQAN